MNAVYQVKITEQAEAQLSEIVRYITSELKAPASALHVLDTLETAIQSLAHFPGKIALIEKEPWRSNGIHKLPVHHYLIYFWIDEAAQKVQVTGVIYGRRDQVRQLSQMKQE